LTLSVDKIIYIYVNTVTALPENNDKLHRLFVTINGGDYALITVAGFDIASKETVPQSAQNPSLIIDYLTVDSRLEKPVRGPHSSLCNNKFLIVICKSIGADPHKEVGGWIETKRAESGVGSWEGGSEPLPTS